MCLKTVLKSLVDKDSDSLILNGSILEPGQQMHSPLFPISVWYKVRQEAFCLITPMTNNLCGEPAIDSLH